ncbi:hypothetical protein [Streptomyces sp. sk2.1]|uniref:hypothetical protein n=1 Tax=Streptomyces sp. sk2.1 TaxID=2478959 RepID=UPI0011E7DCCE|nr:hypothetical protein [Streptomyces sp. sk2.1]TXS66880.1 hypothetical protein EAO76_28675 [Streptomyces sp. sk2.1]
MSLVPNTPVHPVPPLLMRERQSSTDSSSGTPGSAGTPGPADDNPFAAPPENRPDQPWQPRLPPASSERPDSSG